MSPEGIGDDIVAELNWLLRSILANEEYVALAIFVREHDMAGRLFRLSRFEERTEKENDDGRAE